MNLEQTKDAFIIWVYSCITEEQLRLLESIADEFVVNRFEKIAPIGERLHISAQISYAMERQKEQIAIRKMKKDLLESNSYTKP